MRYSFVDTRGCHCGRRALQSRKQMVICNLEGYDMEKHMNKEDVCVAKGPNVRADKSEGGHGYG